MQLNWPGVTRTDVNLPVCHYLVFSLQYKDVLFQTNNLSKYFTQFKTANRTRYLYLLSTHGLFICGLMISPCMPRLQRLVNWTYIFHLRVTKDSFDGFQNSCGYVADGILKCLFLCLCFDWNFTRVVPVSGSHWQNVSLGLDKGLAPFSQEAISEPSPYFDLVCLHINV